MTIEEIEKLLSEAAPGPWDSWTNEVWHEKYQKRSVVAWTNIENEKDVTPYASVYETEFANAKLIAAAPTIIRQLLDVVKAAKKFSYRLHSRPEFDHDSLCGSCYYKPSAGIYECGCGMLEFRATLQALEAKASE
jgi:hypothetical protein